MSGQADRSFAAFADLSKVGGWVKNSSRRALSTAILTVSSNRSNSTSVIALSKFESAEILTVRIAIVPKMTDMPLQFMIAPFSSLRKDKKKGPLCQDCSLLSAFAGHLFHQDARDCSLIGGDYGQVGWQTDRDLADSGADGFAACSLAARDRSATTYG